MNCGINGEVAARIRVHLCGERSKPRDPETIREISAALWLDPVVVTRVLKNLVNHNHALQVGCNARNEPTFVLGNMWYVDVEEVGDRDYFNMSTTGQVANKPFNRREPTSLGGTVSPSRLPFANSERHQRFIRNMLHNTKGLHDNSSFDFELHRKHMAAAVGVPSSMLLSHLEQKLAEEKLKGSFGGVDPGYKVIPELQSIDQQSAQQKQIDPMTKMVVLKSRNRRPDGADPKQLYLSHDFIGDTLSMFATGMVDGARKSMFGDNLGASVEIWDTEVLLPSSLTLAIAEPEKFVVKAEDQNGDDIMSITRKQFRGG